ncbi:hemerythrin domain-containing protein [Paraburkholderia rhizosphaerae]|uniref:Hemerythrin HHE cation binding domain-containing protein n=1 Tax=Paraburkholderia rhizosphaerae TaxID=480658 RepID=A0A4R8M0B9_9BURK|nr:hemerythrin domain-containing protein [Paraburkholderia rhizosphaerae]TDY53966.1 hemerythrin HHE cation binding domain-containing protein [Paraburkholderia rhizosphaerae]
MSTANQDAIALLTEDHRSVDKLFDAFERAAADDLDAKGTLAQRACEKLTVHTIIEEEILYPAAHDALRDRDVIDVDEAYVEHFLVKTLIARFDTLKPGQRGFDATFKVLTEMVRHHVEEEETSLFPELRDSGVDLAALGRKLAAKKTQLEEKLEAAGSRMVGDKT